MVSVYLGMIKVKIQKLSGDILSNDIAKDLARKVQNDFKSHVCDIHPKRISYLIVTVRKSGMKLRKGSFCCPDFKKTIKIR